MQCQYREGPSSVYFQDKSIAQQPWNITWKYMLKRFIKKETIQVLLINSILNYSRFAQQTTSVLKSSKVHWRFERQYWPAKWGVHMTNIRLWTVTPLHIYTHWHWVTLVDPENTRTRLALGDVIHTTTHHQHWHKCNWSCCCPQRWWWNTNKLILLLLSKTQILN